MKTGSRLRGRALDRRDHLDPNTDHRAGVAKRHLDIATEGLRIESGLSGHDQDTEGVGLEDHLPLGDVGVVERRMEEEKVQLDRAGGSPNGQDFLLPDQGQCPGEQDGHEQAGARGPRCCR